VTAPADAPAYDPSGPSRPAGTRAVRPRNAATLILVRRDLGEPRLLMGRRSGGHDFMPDKWVFPGGRVDRCDFDAPAATELAPEVAARLAATAPAKGAHTLPRALAMAAVRETFEEAGLLLAQPSAPRPAIGGWRAFLEAGAAPDLAALDFVARAITPPSRPKRFDARFFMAEATALLSLERRADTGELGEIDWFSFDEVEALDLPNVTRFVVREIAQRLAEPGRPVLSLSARHGKRHLAML
jgi:8-oxo-dGTP pyrophosphatase MutT (NUDIX family)